MKIVHICLGGIVTDGFVYQDNLLPKYQEELGYDVTFITSTAEYDSNGKIVTTDKLDYTNEFGVHMKRLPTKYHKKVTDKFVEYPGLYQLLEFEHPDILFIHGVQFLEIKTVTKFLKHHPNIIAYADNHADFSNSGSNFISRNILHRCIWRHFSKKLNPYIKQFYGVLPARVDWLVDMYKLPKEKCSLLVMGVDDEQVERTIEQKSRQKIRKRYGIREDEFLIVTGGKIDLSKVQTLSLMRAVSELNEPKLKLVVFGSVVDKIRSQFQTLVDDNKIQYVGWVDAAKSYDFLCAADLAVFPGRHSVYWEQATGMGIPLVCKYWPGTTHVDLGGNVKFLHGDSVEEMKCIIHNILHSPEEYVDMKRIARNSGPKVFSYREIAKKSIEFKENGNRL